MSDLVLVRHGQSTWNLENRFTGWTDVPLTFKGKEEAKEAGQILKNHNFTFDKAYTSTLKRANQTLDIILEELNLNIPIIKDKALNERHYGSLQGMNKDQAALEFGKEQIHIWRRSYDIAPPEGESLKDTAERTLPFFREIICPEIRAGKNILIAAHGNSLRSIIMMLDDLSEEEILKINLDTGVPIVYNINEEYKATNKKILSAKYAKKLKES